MIISIHYKYIISKEIMVKQHPLTKLNSHLSSLLIIFIVKAAGIVKERALFLYMIKVMSNKKPKAQLVKTY